MRGDDEGAAYPAKRYRTKCGALLAADILVAVIKETNLWVALPRLRNLIERRRYVGMHLAEAPAGFGDLIDHKQVIRSMPGLDVHRADFQRRRGVATAGDQVVDCVRRIGRKAAFLHVGECWILGIGRRFRENVKAVDAS